MCVKITFDLRRYISKVLPIALDQLAANKKYGCELSLTSFPQHSARPILKVIFAFFEIKKRTPTKWCSFVFYIKATIERSTYELSVFQWHPLRPLLRLLHKLDVRGSYAQYPQQIL